MRIVVTGACGFVGRRLTQKLIERGHEAICAVRPGMTLNEPAAQPFVVPDLLEYSGWPEAMAGADAVIHLAGRAHQTGAEPEEDACEHDAGEPPGARAVMDAAQAAGVRRFSFISTVAVFGQGQPAAYAGPGYGPSDPVSPATPYGRAKRAAEEALMASSMEWSIIRPPLVIGRQPPGNLKVLMGLIRRGLPLPLGLSKGRRSFTTMDQLCEALARAAERPKAVGRILHVASRRSVTSAEMARALADGMSVKAKLLPVPPAMAGAALKLTGKGAMASQLFGSFLVDPTSAQEALDLESDLDILEALRQASQPGD